MYFLCSCNCRHFQKSLKLSYEARCLPFDFLLVALIKWNLKNVKSLPLFFYLIGWISLPCFEFYCFLLHVLLCKHSLESNKCNSSKYEVAHSSMEAKFFGSIAWGQKRTTLLSNCQHFVCKSFDDVKNRKGLSQELLMKMLGESLDLFHWREVPESASSRLWSHRV